jgi:hypothetical protein
MNAYDEKIPPTIEGVAIRWIDGANPDPDGRDADYMPHVLGWILERDGVSLTGETYGTVEDPAPMQAFVAEQYAQYGTVAWERVSDREYRAVITRDDSWMEGSHRYCTLTDHEECTD